jgi:type IV pilus assembly protein PilC
MLLVLGVIIVGFFAIKQWAATATGGVTYDRIKLRIPLVGGILHRFGILQFTQSLGTLLSGGTPMVPAIEIASQSITNRLISTRVFSIVQNVREGEPLWRSLESTEVISDMAVEMIKVGESSGALTEMLSNVSEFYDEEIEARLSRLVTMIEPMILIIMGGVIALLLYAFYLPLFQLTSVTNN